MTSPSNPTPRASALKRFGPLVAILVVIVVVAAVVTLTGKDPATTTNTAGPSMVTNPDDLPISYEKAKAAGTEQSITWVDNCDPETGRIKMPTVYALPCVPAFTGDNGGATSPGVTKDTVKIAYYVTPPTGDIMQALAGNLDPPEKTAETVDRFTEMLNGLFEGYGRKVELVRYDAVGTSSDAVAAKADAQAVIDRYQPFASINGPALTNAYAEELARQGVLCLFCGLANPDQTFQDLDPYLWSAQASPEEYLVILNEYVTQRLAGRKASFAGDELKDRERKFAVVHFEQDPPVFSALGDATTKCSLGGASLTGLLTQAYTLDLARLGERATTIVAKLKSEGITSVIFLGDPLMPRSLTTAATTQDYFPEWIVTGTVLTDTTALARAYDPQQWKHAFGVSQLGVRVPREQGDSWKLHEWYFGAPPAAGNLQAVIFAPILQLFQGIHMAGKNLTPQTFKQGMANLPIGGGGPTHPQTSYGDHGYFKLLDPETCTMDKPRFDHLGIDDMTEIWWDATATGPDEQGKEGTGMWRYANGGKRYLPGTMPKTDADAFKTEGSITVLNESPPGDKAPEYPPPAKG